MSTVGLIHFYVQTLIDVILLSLVILIRKVNERFIY